MRSTHSLIVALVLTISASAFAQYPKITADVAKETERRLGEMYQRSDEAWAKAQPEIQAWAKKGKPYLPGAAKPDQLPQADIPAFPGAQGGGMYSFGGRGGRVIVVTNLNDDGPGSFRAALEAGGPRIVVFNVAGRIDLQSRLVVRAPYLTIDGGSAPGDGVCIANDTVELETHDVVIRNMRFRRGATWVGDRNDALGGNPVGNIIIDHVSACWGLDENLSMYRHMYKQPGGGPDLKLPTVNITIQNSIFSEGLDTYNHAFGSTLGGYNSTFHHNLWACNSGRNASVGMIYDFLFANNVVYNWRHRTVDGGDHRSFYTIVNNYFKPGPATPKNNPVGYRFLKPESRRSKYFTEDYGKAYVAGNVMEGNAEVTADNWAGGVQIEGPPELDVPKTLELVRAKKPYPHSYVEIQPAAEAYETVLAGVGATKPRRDAVDERVIDMVRSGTVTSPENEGIITDIKQVGGYPEYKGEPYADADSDGLPDAWEAAHKLNPNDAADAVADSNGDGYTNIEDFLNGLDPNAPNQACPAPRTYVDLFWQEY